MVAYVGSGFFSVFLAGIIFVLLTGVFWVTYASASEVLQLLDVFGFWVFVLDFGVGFCSSCLGWWLLWCWFEMAVLVFCFAAVVLFRGCCCYSVG
jgi:hypothetical protein